MADVDKMYDSPNLTFQDRRQDYGEERWITVGFVSQRLMVVVWTPREEAMRVISMRKANGREKRLYGERLR